MKKGDLERCRAMLLAQRERILASADRVLSSDLDLDPDDLPDEMAASLAQSRLSFTGGTQEREPRLLNKLEKTLEASGSGSSASAIEPQPQLVVFAVASRPARESDCGDPALNGAGPEQMRHTRHPL